MPSPLAHSAMAVLIAPIVLRALPPSARLTPKIALFGGVLFGALAADLDIAIGYARGHNGFAVHGEFTHSFALAIMFALTFAIWAPLVAPVGHARALAAGLLAYTSHLLLDFLNHGRGIMLFWPISSERYASPARIFYGVRHSDLTNLSHHTMTLGTELVFAAGIVLLSIALYRRRAKPTEPLAER